jgi:hypothetical protein
MPTLIATWLQQRMLAPQGAIVMPLMARGLKRGLIKFNLITGVKASE